MRVVIRVLYAYCQSYSDIHGYSDKGGEGGRVVIRVLYAYCQSYYGFQSGQLTKHGTTGHHSASWLETRRQTGHGSKD